MAPSLQSLAVPRRRLLFLFAAGILLLTAAGALLGAEVVGMAGLSLLMLLSLAALAVAAGELEQDVIYLAGLGVLAGAAHARLSGGAALAVVGAGEAWAVLANALAGGVVGAAAGDVARAGSNRMTRSTLARALASAWWADRRGLARWLAPLGWLAAVAAAMAVAFLIVLVHSATASGRFTSELLPNFHTYLEEVETYPTALEQMSQSLLRVWYAFGLLLPALAMCVNLPLRRQAALEADRLLSRIALAHCLTLALLGASLLLAALSGLSRLSAGVAASRTPHGDLASVVAAIRDIQPPLIMFLVSLICLGRWRWRYLQRFGWMLAIGAAILAACSLAAFAAIFLANARIEG